MKRLNEILPKSNESAITADAGATSFAEEEADGRCPLCGGSGFIRRTTSLDDPNFGKAFPCRCVADESGEARLERLSRYSNLRELSRHRFDTLVRRGRSSAPEHQERFAQAVALTEAYAEAPEGWLVLCGPSGAGKTHLAAAIANRIIERGQPMMFMIVADLLDHLRAAYAPDADLSYDKLFEQVRNAPVLVLDDLGGQSATDWAEEKLYQIINHRYNTGAATIVTLARPLERLDERLRTRLGDERIARVLTLESGAPAAHIDDGMDQPMLRGMTFESFDTKDMSLPVEDRRTLENAHRQALAFAQEPEGWLVFYGPPGSGKTHLAAAIGNVCRRSGMAVQFQFVPDLLNHLRSSFRPDSPVSYDDLFERVRAVPLLILDDFGAHSTSPWAQEKLYQIINYRYTSRLPTVITTSQPVGEMDERLVTRFTDHKVSTVVPTIAPPRTIRGAEPSERPRGGSRGGRRTRQ